MANINIKAFKKLKTHILRHAKEYRQNFWWGAMGPPSNVPLAEVPRDSRVIYANLAGHACLMTGWKLVPLVGTDSGLLGMTDTVVKAGRKKLIPDVASRILGLKVKSAYSLFGFDGREDEYCSSWEPVNRKMYKKARTSRQRARAAAAELDLYIQGVKG